MSQRLALFDLDNTLLAGDSDNAWGEFLISEGLVDENSHRKTNNKFYEDYVEGVLDIHAYVAFTLTPIIDYGQSDRDTLHAKYMQHSISPMLLDTAFELVAKHKAAGDFCSIVTATNNFLTKPIAKLFEVDLLLATDVEVVNDSLTGRIDGIPCFQDGKVRKLEQWLAQSNSTLSLADSVFYTDSINDLPLMQQVAESIAVDPDQKLAAISQEKGWQTLSLRG
jgi:HAD superfamily hydrolase (TIGR01490 family)